MKLKTQDKLELKKLDEEVQITNRLLHETDNHKP